MNEREVDINQTAYDIIVAQVGRHSADDLVADLADAGFVIIPEEDEATQYELEQRA